MGILSYNRLKCLYTYLMRGSREEHINATSIDILLGSVVYTERVPDLSKPYPVIDMLDKASNHLEQHILDEEGIVVPPGGVLLAQSQEIFDLPDWISAEYMLKSTQARNFFGHLKAGWCDAGWNGSVLTLEFVNHNQYHGVRVKPGMKCGQMVFHEHETVPEHASYRTKGQYNGDKIATPGKGLR